MDNNFADYVGNIIASMLLCNSKTNNEQLKTEHKKILENLINSNN